MYESIFFPLHYLYLSLKEIMFKKMKITYYNTPCFFFFLIAVTVLFIIGVNLKWDFLLQFHLWIARMVTIHRKMEWLFLNRIFLRWREEMHISATAATLLLPGDDPAAPSMLGKSPMSSPLLAHPLWFLITSVFLSTLHSSKAIRWEDTGPWQSILQCH